MGKGYFKFFKGSVNYQSCTNYQITSKPSSLVRWQIPQKRTNSLNSVYPEPPSTCSPFSHVPTLSLVISHPFPECRLCAWNIIVCQGHRNVLGTLPQNLSTGFPKCYLHFLTFLSLHLIHSSFRLNILLYRISFQNEYALYPVDNVKDVKGNNPKHWSLADPWFPLWTTQQGWQVVACMGARGHIQLSTVWAPAPGTGLYPSRALQEGSIHLGPSKKDHLWKFSQRCFLG